MWTTEKPNESGISFWVPSSRCLGWTSSCCFSLVFDRKKRKMSSDRPSVFGNLNSTRQRGNSLKNVVLLVLLSHQVSFFFTLCIYYDFLLQKLIFLIRSWQISSSNPSSLSFILHDEPAFTPSSLRDGLIPNIKLSSKIEALNLEKVMQTFGNLKWLMKKTWILKVHVHLSDRYEQWRASLYVRFEFWI